MLKLLFLLLTVSAAGAWSVWKWAPDQIQRVEDWAIRGYMKAPNEGLKRAVDLGKAGDWEAAIVILESQAEDLKGYKKLDRLFRLRRRTVQQLAVATAEAGDPLRASKVVSKFLQDDPKDLPLAIQSAKLLTEADSEEARAAGRERYAELFTWLPLVSTIAKGHIEQLAQHGDPAELELAVAKHLEFVERPVQVMQNLQFGWYFRHGTESALGKASRSPINPLRQKGELVIPFAVPAGAKFLRIDLPPYAVAELSNARMVLGGKTTHLGEPSELKSLEWRDGQMSASGRPVAWFSYPLPELGDQAKVRGSLRFELTALPSWLEAHLGSGVGRKLQNLSMEAGAWEKFALLREAWIRYRTSTPIRIRGAKGTTVYKHSMGKHGMAVNFDCTVDFSPSTNELVVVLPFVVGDVMVLDHFELQQAGDSVRWTPDLSTVGFVMDGIDWQDGIGLVVKDRPQMRWAANGTGSVTKLELRGQVK